MWLPFKREKALTGDPAVLQAMHSTGWSPYPLLGGGSRQRIQEAYNVAKGASYPWLYANSPSLRQVIDCIVRNAGQLEMRLYEEKSPAERTPKPDHPAALSCRYPSELVSADKFIRQMFKDFLIYDDATALMTEAPGRQLNFNWIPFSSMELHGSGIFAADEYRYWRTDGTWQDFPAANIFHWHGENPSDPRIGLSHFDTLREVIAEEVALRQATTELGNAGLTEAVWAYRPLEAPVMGKPAQDAFEDELTAKVRRKNRRVAVTQEGTELRSFGVSPKDAQMVELRHKIMVQVAGEYGLPLGMLSETPSEEARTIFINDCLQPLCENYTRFLDQRVLVRIYNWTDGTFEFYLDEKRMGNDTMRALVSASGRPVMLTNEARMRLNLSPVDGGDELVTPANVIVGDNPKPSVDVMPVQDPNKPPQDGSHRTEETTSSSSSTTSTDGGKALAGFTEAMRKQTDAANALQESESAEHVLHHTFVRYERSYEKHRSIDERRFTRELYKDLAEACPEVEVRELAAMVDGLYKALATALENEQADVVFGAAQRNAGTIAERLLGMGGSERPELTVKELQELGVPDEVVWRRANFSEEEIDDMTATKYARDLLEASRGSHPSGA